MLCRLQDLTCAIADLGLCVKHDAETDAVDFPPEMGAVDEGGSAKVSKMISLTGRILC